MLLEPKSFLRGLHPIKPSLKGLIRPAPLMLAILAFPLNMFTHAIMFEIPKGVLALAHQNLIEEHKESNKK